MLGDSVAVVSYVRLQQRVSGAGEHSTACSEETRVWELQQGRWVNVHMHRSACP
jgi:calcium/calmodulin-dependent protein kinase (CaM kinase) II